MTPEVSIVIPVYNEEESLPDLFGRLFPVVESLGRNCEVIFVNDGSRDRSLGLLLEAAQKKPYVRVVDFNGNFGQHMAIMAGFSKARGDKIITMDADLQNPPEEIPRILEQMDLGHDMVGTYRVMRKDPVFTRKLPSKLINWITNRITGLNIRDYGCMLRGYHRRVVDLINMCRETTTFLPALGKKFAQNPVEIPVSHEERHKGTSKYGLYRLIRLNFDLMTGFSMVPLQGVTITGLFVSAASFLFAMFLIIRRILVGSEAEGMFTLMAINFFLMGILLFGVGIAGEYVGRIYMEVRQRPRYLIKMTYPDDLETGGKP
jgi:undecaprenyl-phosphate 4-deoxy-4-formamido-L-arabinose transferase